MFAGVAYLLVIDSFFNLFFLSLDGLMLSVLKEVEGIWNGLMKVMYIFE